MRSRPRPARRRSLAPLFPPARGTRLRWPEIPEAIRAGIEARLGARVMAVRTRSEGFSPAFAGVVKDSRGIRTFLKVVGPTPNPDAPEFYRREARSLSRLPVGLPVPKLLWTADDGAWVVLAFEPLPGRTPPLPWRHDDVIRVFRAVQELSDRLTPAPPGFGSAADHYGRAFVGWRSIRDSPEPGRRDRLDGWTRDHLGVLAELESDWVAACRGDSLLHGDLRADNILLTADRVFFVDWPDACIGAPWFDVVCMLPSVAMQGGPRPWDLWGELSGTESVPEDQLRRVVAAIAGFFVARSMDPPPPGLPTLRAFQRGQARPAVDWLRHLI